jgi:hypothetical protein
MEKGMPDVTIKRRSVPQVRLPFTHDDDVFEAVGRLVHLRPGLGMEIGFETIAEDQPAKRMQWLETREEY